MYFQSFGFLFFFLPILFLSMRLFTLGWKKKIVLLFFSYLFYSSNEPYFVFLLIISSAVDYFVAIQIHQSKELLIKRIWLFVSIFTNLGILAFFKYGGWILSQFDFPTQNFFLTFVLPAGISFYTFQSMSYSIDVYRDEITPKKDLLGFFNYVSYLPQLIAGPIERYNYLAPQLENFAKNKLKSYWSHGIDRLALGIFQKLVIADSCGRIVDFLATNKNTFDLVSSWLFSISFGLQIYYDFSSYVNMAIGISMIFGIRLSENFLSPYKAVNIQDFWRRWHITLSQWLRDYLYYPLGGSRYGNIRTFFNILATFVLCGLWHGAGYNFILWGVLHAFYLIAFRIYQILFPKVKLPNTLGIFLTFILVMFAWVPFRIDDSYSIFLIWNSMLGGHGFISGLTQWISIFDFSFIGTVLLATLWMPNCKQRWPGTSGVLESFLLWTLAMVALLNSPITNNFIYFKF